jgi:hypothetical protein
MAKKKDLFSIKDSELAQWFSIELQKLDQIVDFFDSDPDDDWDLVEDQDYKYVNKTKKIRIFSAKGALKIATYLDQHQERGIFYKIKEFITRHDKKLRKSFAQKLITEELIDVSSIIVHNGYPMIYKQSLRRILETNGSKLNQTFNSLQKSHQPLELDVDFAEKEQELWFAETGVVRMAKSMSETLTNKSRREMCQIISGQFPPAFKLLIDAETKQQIEIDNAKKRAKTKDKHTCQITNKKPDKYNQFNLSVHHLYCAKACPHLATVDINLITISEDIHKEFHGHLGGFDKPCTLDDFIDFVHTYYPEHDSKLTLRLQKAKKALGHVKPKN